jgi:hypothetical protein
MSTERVIPPVFALVLLAFFIGWQLHPREPAVQRLREQCVFIAGEHHSLRRECESLVRSDLLRRRECETIVREARASLGMDVAEWVIEHHAAYCITQRTRAEGR